MCVYIKIFNCDTNSRFLWLTLLAASSASSTYFHIRLRNLLLAASLSFESEMVSSEKSYLYELCFPPQAINQAMLINRIFARNIFVVQGLKI
jgi:hypothetical protein